MRLPCALLMILVVSALTGCSTYRARHIDRVQGFVRYEDGPTVQELPNYADAAVKNSKVLERDKANGEWAFNDDPGAPPKVGLALSGGGMRAGTFSIGVLKGLYQSGIADKAGKPHRLLDLIDVISSVSGGGYAASWFYSQNYYGTNSGVASNITEARMFDGNDKYQRYLEDHGELIGHTGVAALRRLEYTKGGLNLVGIPANFLFNGIFGYHWNTAPGRIFYEHGINRVFARLPEDGYTGPSLIKDYFAGPEHSMTFEELSSLLEKRKSDSSGRLPFWIINTTANIDDNTSHFGSSLSNTVFEFTPLHYGSEYFRYWGKGRYDSKGSNGQVPSFPFKVPTAVAVSGAAVDSNVATGSATKILASSLNFDLGYYIKNPDPSITTASRDLHFLLPFPFYLLHNYNKDGNGLKIYLTDGGQSENLGAYALIKRLCQKIIIIDAEHDPQMEYGAYWILKEAVKRDFGADLVVEDIESSEPNVFHPVMKGKVSFFPVQTPAGVEEKELDIYYVKLSMDKKLCDASPYQCQNLFGKNVSFYYLNKGLHGGEFPQQSTADLSFDKDEFKAYRDLGSLLIRNYLTPLLSEDFAN